jgi:hypothetical protein
LAGVAVDDSVLERIRATIGAVPGKRSHQPSAISSQLSVFSGPPIADG